MYRAYDFGYMFPELAPGYPPAPPAKFLSVLPAGSTHSPLSQLPPELLELVGEFADSRDLRQVQLVSKALASATRRIYISKNFAHRHLLVCSPQDLDIAIKVAKRREFSKAIKSLSLFEDAEDSVTNRRIPKLRKLFHLLKNKADDIELIVTDRRASNWRPRGARRRDWYSRQPSSQPAGHFPHNGIRDELKRAELWIKTYSTRVDEGPGRKELFGATRGEKEKWMYTLVRVESLALRGRLGLKSGYELSVLTQLPCLRSLCLEGGSFKDLGRDSYFTDAYEPFRFPHLKKLKLGTWRINLKDLVVFLQQQPVLEHVDLTGARWDTGIGGVLTAIAKPGESFDKLFKRLTKVEKVIADEQAKIWITRVIKGRLG